MLPLLHVLELLLITVLTGLIKLIVKSGTLMVDVLGTLVMIVLLLIILMSQRVNQDILAVLMRLRIVPFTMVMSLLVRERLAVLGVVTIAHL